jgi:hypothetical protein
MPFSTWAVTLFRRDWLPEVLPFGWTDAVKVPVAETDDVSWIAVIPPGLPAEDIEDLRLLFAQGGTFGCCRVRRHALADGWALWIGQHA